MPYFYSTTPSCLANIFKSDPVHLLACKLHCPTLAMPSESLNHATYAGLQSILTGQTSSDSQASNPVPEDIENDLEGEKETIPDLSPQDFVPDDSANISKWQETVTGASKGVTDKMDSQYQRYALSTYLCFL